MIDSKTILELVALVLSVLSSTVFLASRIQKIEDVACDTRDALKTHLEDDKEEFRRVYDRIDRKADKLGGLHPAA